MMFLKYRKNVFILTMIIIVKNCRRDRGQKSYTNMNKNVVIPEDASFVILSPRDVLQQAEG